MTLAEAVAEFEAMFLSVSDEIGLEREDGKRDWSRAPTGEKYLTVTCGGVRPEDEIVAGNYHESADMAVAEWLAHAKALVKEPGKILYWRYRPELSKSARGLKYGVWSRFVVR